MKIYAIGDIHGQITQLDNLLRKIVESEDDFFLGDKIIFIGDYIDRGENSREVVDFLIFVASLSSYTDDVIFLRGNHEQMMLDAYEEPSPEYAGGIFRSAGINFSIWLNNGGNKTLLDYGVDGRPTSLCLWKAHIPQNHIEFLRKTQLEYITDEYHFVHAGLLPPGATWKPEGIDIEPKLWIGEQFLDTTKLFGGRKVVFGHTVQPGGKPLVQGNKIGIDTGAYKGFPLTAVVLEPTGIAGEFNDPQFIQV